MSKNAVQGYQILKIIGKGAFAIVYQAQNIKTKEIVAVKQITIEQGDSPHKEKLMELFKTEIQIMQKMKHHNILELKEVQYSPDYINMIIEYCTQGDLEKFIKKHALKNRLSEEEGKPIILQIVEAMKILRLNNVVHRDLKLANILINEQMQIKLADFGFAKLSETEMMESYCGTPITMAPEILKKVDYYDCKCDIWSLGVMIYQILFGAPPFLPQKGTVADLLIAIQQQKLNFPQHIPVSNECKDLLRKMLVEDPQKRMSFEELFRHPWTIIDRDILDKSVLQVNQDQHTQFIEDLQFTLQLKQKEINSNIQKIIEEMSKITELEGLGVRLRNRTQSLFQQFKLNIKYSNKFVIIENQQHFKRIDYQEEILLFLIDLYEFGITHSNYDLQSIFDLIDKPQNISNVLTIQYEEYTSNLEQELKKFKRNSNVKNNGKLLQICNDNPQFKLLDIQVIIGLANDRYAL